MHLPLTITGLYERLTKTSPTVLKPEELRTFRAKLWKHQQTAAQTLIPTRLDEYPKGCSISYLKENEALKQFLNHVKYEFFHDYQSIFLESWEERKMKLAELQVGVYKQFIEDKTPEETVERQMFALRELDRSYVAYSFTTFFDVDWKLLNGFQQGVVSSWRFNRDGSIETEVIEETSKNGVVNKKVVLLDNPDDPKYKIHIDTLRRIGKRELETQLAQNPHRFHRTFLEYSVRKKNDHLPEAELNKLVAQELNRDRVINNCVNLKALGDRRLTFCESCALARRDVNALNPVAFRALNKYWVDLVWSSKFDKLLDDRIEEERTYEHRIWAKAKADRYDQFVTELVDFKAFVVLESICRDTAVSMLEDPFTNWSSPKWGSGFVWREIRWTYEPLERPVEMEPQFAYERWFKVFWGRYGEPSESRRMALAPGNPSFVVAQPDSPEASIWLTGLAFTFIAIAVFAKNP